MSVKTPKIFRSCVVPHPIRDYSHHSRQILSKDDPRRYEVSYRDMQRMTPALHNKPVKANHEGEDIGRVIRSYELNRKMYADCELFDTPSAKVVRGKIKSGRMKCVSLQHDPVTLEVLELSVCERGRRVEADITDILVSASASDELKDNVYKQHNDAGDEYTIEFIDDAYTDTIMASTSSSSNAARILELQRELSGLQGTPQQSAPMETDSPIQPAPSVNASDEDFNKWLSIIKDSTSTMMRKTSVHDDTKRQYVASMVDLVNREKANRVESGKQRDAASAATSSKELEYNEMKTAYHALLADQAQTAMNAEFDAHGTPMDMRGRIVESFSKGQFASALSMLRPPAAVVSPTSILQTPTASSSSPSSLSSSSSSSSSFSPLQAPPAAVAASHQPSQSESILNSSLDQLYRLTDYNPRQAYQQSTPPYHQQQYSPYAQHAQQYHYQGQGQGHVPATPQQYRQVASGSNIDNVFSHLGTVKASMPVGPDYASVMGENRSAVRFANGRSWNEINMDPVAAALLNNATGNVDNVDFNAMKYPGSKYDPLAESKLMMRN